MIYSDIVIGALTPLDVKINDLELAARIGAGPDYSNESIPSYIKEVESVASYKYAYVKVPLTVCDDICDFGFSSVTSRDLSRVLSGCSEAILLGTSVGLGVDRLIARYAPTSRSASFLIDAIGSATAEALCDTVYSMLSKEFPITNRFSPGYGDLPLEFQGDLLARLCASASLGISLSDSLLMSPQKSITAIIGIKNDR